MSEFCIDPKFGRVAFGDDPAGYHATRPEYPDWVFETLRDRCQLAVVRFRPWDHSVGSYVDRIYSAAQTVEAPTWIALD
jgi:hypothetical protein